LLRPIVNLIVTPGASGAISTAIAAMRLHPDDVVSLKRLLDAPPWLQFTSECQRF
jgi:hypothetical protein